MNRGKVNSGKWAVDGWKMLNEIEHFSRMAVLQARYSRGTPSYADGFNEGIAMAYALAAESLAVAAGLASRVESRPAKLKEAA